MHKAEHDDTATTKSLKIRAVATGNKKTAIFAIIRQFYTNNPYTAIITIGKSKQDNYKITHSVVIPNDGIVFSSTEIDDWTLDIVVSKGGYGNALGMVKVIELYNDGINTSFSLI